MAGGIGGLGWWEGRRGDRAEALRLVLCHNAFDLRGPQISFEAEGIGSLACH